MDSKDSYPSLSPQEANVFYKKKVEKKTHVEIGKELGFTITDRRCRTSEAYMYKAYKKIEDMRTTLNNIDKGL